MPAPSPNSPNAGGRSVPATTRDGRRPRADAVANRGRIVGIAREVFEAEGTGVPMAEIARRAGVGLATAFRHFATHQDLLAEVVADRVAACAATVTGALDDRDGARAFRTAVHRLCRLQCGARGLAPALVTALEPRPETDPFPAQRAAFEAASTALIQRARDSGALDPCVRYADLLLLLKANAGIVTLTSSEAVPQESRRLADAALGSFAVRPAAPVT